MAINKVVYGGNVLIDLTGDDVVAANVTSGIKFHLPDGTQGTGSNTYDADTQDANATASEILSTKTAYVRGSKITGSMNNRGAVTGIISAKTDSYIVPQGYHDGSGTVSIDSTEQAKIIAGNIKSGIEILGVEGTYAGEAVTAQSRSVNATSTQLTVLPESGFDYLSQVIVTIPYTSTGNAAGGTTITIA